MILDLTHLGQHLRDSVEVSDIPTNIWDSWQKVFFAEKLQWQSKKPQTAKSFLEWGSINLKNHFNNKLGFYK